MIRHYLWPQVSVYLHKTWQFVEALMHENLLCDLGGHKISVFGLVALSLCNTWMGIFNPGTIDASPLPLSRGENRELLIG